MIRLTFKTQIAFISIFLVAHFVLAQKLKIENLSISKSGEISWSTKNEKEGTKFEIMGLQIAQKWKTVATVIGKGAGANYYTFQTDTTCPTYIFKIKAIDTKEHKSNEIKNSDLNPVSITKQTSQFIKFSAKVPFEIYDQYGNFQFKGCDSSVNISNLKHGVYYLNIGLITTEFRH